MRRKKGKETENKYINGSKKKLKEFLVHIFNFMLYNQVTVS
jgi:hypothetical protein